MKAGGWFDRLLIALACAGAVLLLSLNGCTGRGGATQALEGAGYRDILSGEVSR